LDISDLKEILRILEAQDITEFELEQDGVKLRVCRSASAPAPAAGMALANLAPTPAAFSAALPAAPPTPAAAPPTEPAQNGTVVKSPIVGTFYRAGDRVKLGQVLCIIEAMKLMNEIEAEVAGEIVKIHPENGQPVQYGDPLFTVRPD
jgi:acetyl-CoA carboxylase biotin carboxyl carrier protein